MAPEGEPVAAQIDGGVWRLPLAPLSATSLPEVRFLPPTCRPADPLQGTRARCVPVLWQPEGMQPACLGALRGSSRARARTRQAQRRKRDRLERGAALSRAACVAQLPRPNHVCYGGRRVQAAVARACKSSQGAHARQGEPD